MQKKNKKVHTTQDIPSGNPDGYRVYASSAAPVGYLQAITILRITKVNEERNCAYKN